MAFLGIGTIDDTLDLVWLKVVGSYFASNLPILMFEFVVELVSFVQQRYH